MCSILISIPPWSSATCAFFQVWHQIDQHFCFISSSSFENMSVVIFFLFVLMVFKCRSGIFIENKDLYFHLLPSVDLGPAFLLFVVLLLIIHGRHQFSWSFTLSPSWVSARSVLPRHFPAWVRAFSRPRLFDGNTVILSAHHGWILPYRNDISRQAYYLCSTLEMK